MCYKPKSVGLRDISVGVNGKPLTGSPWRNQVIGHQYKVIHSFGSRGIEPGQFQNPIIIAVSERTGKIAIADHGNRRVQLFDREYKYLRTIGDKGRAAERIKYPKSVGFTASDEVIVIHGELLQTSKMFLFTEYGDFIKVISQDLIDPFTISVKGDGHMIVCDLGDKSVKVLSPDGVRLVHSFKGTNAIESPGCAVYHADKFFVSISNDCVRVFNNEGLSV